jgi:hypothetical protein
MAGHRGRVFWSRHVAAVEGSGLSRAAYCRQHGLDYATFRLWTRRLAKDLSESANAQALVPLRVSTRSEVGGGELRLQVGAGVSLGIPQAVDPRWLATLLRESAC